MTSLINPNPLVALKNLTLEIVQLFLRGEKHQGKEIYTASFSTIEDAAAAELTKHDKPWVFLNGLVEISEPAAQSLAQIQSNLALGLVDLSPPVAAELAKHKGFLSFNRLSDVSDSVAEKLGQHQGGLFLSGLTELTETARRSRGRPLPASPNRGRIGGCA